MTIAHIQQATCPVCHSSQTQLMITIPQAPVLCNILWQQKEDALRVAKSDITLTFCHHCGHIFNATFDPSLLDYSQVYENSLHYSPHFQQFAETLALALITRHHLRQKQLIEISCGKGDFLEMMCELGNNRGVGFDPSYVPGQTARSATANIQFVQDFYSEKYQHYMADFLYCRHTLEHVEDPVGFLQMVRRTIGDRPVSVYFEMPNVHHTLQALAIWDIIYEHCGYFSKQSLGYLFAHHGFAIDSVETTYGNQFLYVEATACQGDTPWVPNHQVNNLAEEVATFAQKYQAKVAADEERLLHLQQSGKKAVIWGTGAKGIAFLNTMRSAQQIEYAVDLNPRKHGKFVTGTGQQIVPPQFLQHYQPDVIFVMNPIYRQEIEQMVDELGLTVEFVSV